MTDEEREHGPALDETETIRLPRSEFARLLNDNARLNAQISEVQAANSALVEERQIDPSIGLGNVRADVADRSAMVREFNREVMPDRETLPSPGLLSPSSLRFRMRAILGEVVELLDEVYNDRAAVDQLRACFDWFLDVSQYRRDLYFGNERFARFVHEAIDVAYTVESLLAASGIDGTPAFRLVHSKNLTKKGLPVDEKGRFVKPVGWIPPDVAGELERQRLAAARKGAENEGSAPEPTETRPNVEPPRDGPPSISDEDIAREAARYANERVRHIVGSAEPTAAQTRLAARLLRGEQTSDVGGWVDAVSAFVAGANLFRGAAKV